MKNQIYGLVLLTMILLLGSSSSVLAQEKKCCKERTDMKTFSGKIEPMGMSIFMQGTHQLVDGKGETIVLLQAGDQGLDLNAYVNKKVTVSGTLADTVEAGGQILTVTSVENS